MSLNVNLSKTQKTVLQMFHQEEAFCHSISDSATTATTAAPAAAADVDDDVMMMMMMMMMNE